jgi:hypothetical protein
MSETPTESGTRDTTAVSGGGTGTSTADRASNRDTTVTGGGGVDDPSNSAATQPDTTGAQGGENEHHTDDPTQYLTGTTDTQSSGAPANHADPAYRPPSLDPSASNVDTTWTDRPVSDGVEIDQSNQWQSENLDTQNPKVALQTTTANMPGTPAKPTVAAGARGATVTWVAVADPAGAPIRGYRVEGSTTGVAFAGRNATSKFVNNLTPSQAYKFRVAAVNDNGVGDYSDWSDAVTPLNPDQAGPGHPTTVTPENRVNPIYNARGEVKAGTGGTTGPVGSVTAAATGVAGQLDVDWTAPTWGDADGFVVRASSGEEAVVGDVLTALLTGLDSGVAVTVTVTPTNEAGSGISKTSAAATPL